MICKLAWGCLDFFREGVLFIGLGALRRGGEGSCVWEALVRE